MMIKQVLLGHSEQFPIPCVACDCAPTAHQQQGILAASLVEFPTSFWVLLALQELFLNLDCFDFFLGPLRWVYSGISSKHFQ